MKAINKKKSALCWLWMSAIIIVGDQATKYLVLRHLSYDQPVAVLPFLNFTLRFNTGAAFSFLGDASGWQIYLLAGISIVVSVLLIIWLSRLRYADWMTALPLSLILGGALGNLLDRVRFRYVVDFIDFHLGAWHFATFNVADAAVSVGAVGLILGLFYESITRKS